MPGPDKLFPNQLLGLPELGTGRFGGSGNYLWALTDDLTWVKAIPGSSGSSSSRITTTVWLAAAGSYDFNRGATAGFLPNGTLDTTGASERVRELSCSARCRTRTSDQSLRLGPVAIPRRTRRTTGASTTS